jgi:hypothetical protein
MLAMNVHNRESRSLESADEAKRRVSRHGAVALAAMLAPAVGFPLLLLFASRFPRFAWLATPARYPWELWLITVCGTAATLGGVLDWRFHRSGETAVGRGEHLSHVAALVGGGLPLFVLMAVASVVRRPAVLLLPILVVAGATIVMICYDEFVFHRRRCAAYETLTHRLLTLGNGAAWLAWMHWVYVRPSAAWAWA